MVAVQSSVDQKTPEVKEPVVDEAVEEPSPSPEVEVAPAEPAPEPEIAEPQWQDEVRVVLTPGEGTEFKLTMEEGATARFSWVSEGGPINFDTHGDGGGQSISYEKGRAFRKMRVSLWLHSPATMAGFPKQERQQHHPRAENGRRLWRVAKSVINPGDPTKGGPVSRPALLPTIQGTNKKCTAISRDGPLYA